jgi:hypothetical protein
MAKAKEVVTLASEPEKVDAYVASLKHPLAQVVKELRQNHSEHRQRNWRRDQVERADILLLRPDEADKPEGVGDDTSLCSIYSGRIAFAWYFRVEPRSKIPSGYWKVTMPTEGAWQCFTAPRM